MKNSLIDNVFAEAAGRLGLRPFPHQLMTLEAVGGGYNVVLTAPTGAGKTEAAVLPVLAMMAAEKTSCNPITVLYITPLRALINDLTRRLKEIFRPYGFNVARKHGDVGAKERRERVKRMPHVLITTPESLEVDMDMSHKLREGLRNVKWVIIDELHEIGTSKRGLQLALLLERLRRLSGDFQVIGLSATIPDPGRVIKPFLGSSMRPLKAIIGGRKRYRITVVKSGNIDEVVRDSVIKNQKTIVFVNSRKLAERLHERLGRDLQDSTAVHHSSIAGGLKENVEALLRKGGIKAVIATKTLELGIDVGGVDRVIHVGAPSSVTSLLQRAGRAGHSANLSSEAIIIADSDESYYLSLIAKYLGEEGRIEDPGDMPCYLDVVAREIIGSCLKQEANVEKVVDIITSVAPCSGSRESVEKVIDLLSKQGLIRVKGGLMRVGRYFYQLWSKAGAGGDIRRFFTNIPSSDERFTVKFGEEVIGLLDTNYVMKYLRPWDRVRIAGKVWEVTKIDLTHKVVGVRPGSSTGIIPSWHGSVISHSSLMTREFFRCLRECGRCGICDTEVVKWFDETGIPPPNDEELLLELLGDVEVLYGGLGHRFFELLGYVLAYAALISGNGVVGIRVSPFGIAGERLTELIKYLRREGIAPETAVEEAVKIMPQYHLKLRELLPSFGTLNDAFVRKEAVKQVLTEFESDGESVSKVKAFLERKILVRAVKTDVPSPIANIISTAPRLRPWYGGSLYVIAEALKGLALTSEEVAEVSGLPKAYVERKLKQMRSLKGRLKTVSIYDVFDGQVRWALAEELPQLSESLLKDSFTPKGGGAYTISLITDKFDPGKSTVIQVGRDSLEKIPEGFKVNEFFKVVIAPLSGFKKKLTYYHVPKNLVPLIILNAITYLEGMGYADIV